MKKLLAATLIGLCLPAMADSVQTVKKGYPFCISENSWDELGTAMARKDNRTLNILIKQQKCGVLKVGMEFTLLDTTWTGTAKIRLWLDDDQYADVWTVTEVTQGK